MRFSQGANLSVYCYLFQARRQGGFGVCLMVFEMYAMPIFEFSFFADVSKAIPRFGAARAVRRG